jgi:phosphoribosylaminoimidazole-succinocarboxamide synthase
MGRVEEAYQEVARRLGVLPEGGTVEIPGPTLVQ